MFLAGVSLWYFAFAVASVAGVVTAVLKSHGTSWQLLHEYQFKRIFTFLDPGADPLGAGYHITQAKIALGSGGLMGRGYMQGTQSRLNFLPEKHTDFILTTLAEEFGFVGTAALLTLYALMRAWNLSFWREDEDSAETEARISYLGAAPAAGVETERRVIPGIMTAATTGMVALTVALTVFAGPLYDVCTRIGEALLHPVSLTQLEDDAAGTEKAP